ncbi:hypothetical protein [Crateriforma spongiae]|uniref:hypothetical protein n=1 Tax=Crateriforma spongiae TaxID=2724528 RepID=UPI0039AECB19
MNSSRSGAHSPDQLKDAGNHRVHRRTRGDIFGHGSIKRAFPVTRTVRRTEIDLNPYEPTSTDRDPVSTHGKNPARPLLFMIGALCTLQGMFALPTGLFVGPHILGAAIAMLLFGATAIWLGIRQFDANGRIATITWGGLAILVLAAAIASEPPSVNDVAVLAFTALVLLIVVAVPAIAILNRP